MRCVYVAGPYRAPSAWEIEQNIRRAETVALELWRSGHVAICPHTMGRFYQGAAPDKVFLDGCLELLRRCDGVLLIGEWEKSSGTRAEIELAHSLGLPVFFSLEAFIESTSSTHDPSCDMDGDRSCVNTMEAVGP